MFLPGFAKLQELRQKLAEVEIQIQETKNQNTDLKERIGQLENDQDYLEIVARETMGVVKKGETVLKIIREDEVSTGNTTATNSTKS